MTRYESTIHNSLLTISYEMENDVEAGVPVEKLERVHAPIGLDIGAVTEEEIAINIVAELIHVPRGERMPVVPKRSDMVPLFKKLTDIASHG